MPPALAHLACYDYRSRRFETTWAGGLIGDKGHVKCIFPLAAAGKLKEPDALSLTGSPATTG
jgi:hypothetical protein